MTAINEKPYDHRIDWIHKMEFLSSNCVNIQTNANKSAANKKENPIVKLCNFESDVSLQYLHPK